MERLGLSFSIVCVVSDLQIGWLECCDDDDVVEPGRGTESELIAGAWMEK